MLKREMNLIGYHRIKVQMHFLSHISVVQGRSSLPYIFSHFNYKVNSFSN